jgi:shikimate kinase
MAFDHSHALFGSNEAEALKRLSDLRHRLAVGGGSVTKGNRHCLIDQLKDESRFNSWIDRIEKLPDHYIETACADLSQRDFITNDECSKVKDFLRHRRDQFRKLVKNHQKAFNGISQFGLTV